MSYPAAGFYHSLTVLKSVDFGLYLDGGEAGEILLPTRFVPEGTKVGEVIDVFIYHDSENRLIATNQHPLVTAGEIGYLKIVTVTAQGAFADWGLMKDLFIPKSQQVNRMMEGERYLIGVYVDEQTERVAGTERIEGWLSNEELTVEEWETVKLLIQRETDLGFKAIINQKHTGLLHFNDVFRNLAVGDQLTGYIKRILPENKIDLSMQARGYARVSPDAEKILEKLRDANGFLPYNDKTSPEEIYLHFGMSKKTFKMATGSLYKDRKIDLTKAGMQLIIE